MNTRKMSSLALVALTVLSMLACTIMVGGPDYPADRIPVSSEAVGEAQAAVQTAASAGLQTGTVTLTLTEPQLTSLLAYKLQEQQDPLITDPQVQLRNGEITIYGTARQGYFRATVKIVLSAGIDSAGQLKIELTSADFGPLPVPEGLRDIITSTVQEAYTGELGPVATGFRLESITIADGNLTVVGKIK
jgi:uncharacterized protein YpmS